MPRLPWRLLARAWKEHPCLPLLLQECRDLASARRELRWLQEHAQSIAPTRTPRSLRWLVHRYCVERSRGKPLQYILGCEYFDELEIQCRPSVLIPRQDTAAYVSHLIRLLKHSAESLPSSLRVLDLCTGSGCIPLLFAHLFQRHVEPRRGGIDLQIRGVDISSAAIDLANLNKQRQLSSNPMSRAQSVRFVRADILARRADTDNAPALMDLLDTRDQAQWDILISNPPYISPSDFNHVTTRSVRNFEPKLALVPRATLPTLPDHAHGDLFYPRLLETAQELNVKILLVEVGDMAQARRVLAMARRQEYWEGVQIWCDEPGATSQEYESAKASEVVGSGHGRSVLCWRGDGGRWLDK